MVLSCRCLLLEEPLVAARDKVRIALQVLQEPPQEVLRLLHARHPTHQKDSTRGGWSPVPVFSVGQCLVSRPGHTQAVVLVPVRAAPVFVPSSNRPEKVDVTRGVGLCLVPELIFVFFFPFALQRSEVARRRPDLHGQRMVSICTRFRRTGKRFPETTERHHPNRLQHLMQRKHGGHSQKKVTDDGLTNYLTPPLNFKFYRVMVPQIA